MKTSAYEMVMRRRSRYVLLKARKAFGVNSNPVLAKNILYIPIPKNTELKKGKKEKVSGLTMSNGRTRNVWFKRVKL